MLTIVTVNYNNAHATERLLRSLADQTDRSFDVIVVDNASDEEDRRALGEAVTSSPLNAQVCWSDVNGGFSAGCNIGIRRAFATGAHWVALINNDAVTTPDAIARLRVFLEGAVPAIVAIPLLEKGKTVRAGLVRWLSATLPHAFDVPSPGTRIYAVGGGMAIHRDVYAKIGPMDERFFLYFEDAEYAERARAAGFPVLIADIPALSHEVSATTSKLGSPLLLRYHMRNALLFNGIHGPWYVRGALPIWALFSMVKQLIKLAAFPARRSPSRAIAAGIVDFYANRYGKIEDARH